MYRYLRTYVYVDIYVFIIIHIYTGYIIHICHIELHIYIYLIYVLHMSYIPQIWVMMILILQDRAYFIDGHRLERLETWQQSLVSQVSSMTLADSVWGVQRGCCSKFSNWCPDFEAYPLCILLYIIYIMIIFLTSLTSCFSGLNVLFRPKTEGHIFERVEKF